MIHIKHYCHTTVCLLGPSEIQQVIDRSFDIVLVNVHRSCQQVYRWLARIDLVERYQVYLNQPSSLIETAFFYNCTWPRFRSWCEYSFNLDVNSRSFSSLSKFIHRSYIHHVYKPETLTCYDHLSCKRGPSPSCLDWSEICDDRIDCLDGGEDEKDCWQLGFSECGKNEYRCANGQYIPKEFHQDNQHFGDCSDPSGEELRMAGRLIQCQSNEPILACEDHVSVKGLPNRFNLDSTCSVSSSVSYIFLIRRLIYRTMTSREIIHLSTSVTTINSVVDLQ